MIVSLVHQIWKIANFGEKKYVCRIVAFKYKIGYLLSVGAFFGFDRATDSMARI